MNRCITSCKQFTKVIMSSLLFCFSAAELFCFLRLALSVIVGWSCWGVGGCWLFKKATCFAKRPRKSQLTQKQKSHRKNTKNSAVFLNVDSGFRLSSRNYIIYKRSELG